MAKKIKGGKGGKGGGRKAASADGSFKDYFLRVPPRCATAREAVAWSFGQPAESYQPAMQS